MEEALLGEATADSHEVVIPSSQGFVQLQQEILHLVDFSRLQGGDPEVLHKDFNGAALS